MSWLPRSPEHYVSLKFAKQNWTVKEQLSMRSVHTEGTVAGTETIQMLVVYDEEVNVAHHIYSEE